MPRIPRAPGYRLHRASGQAVVTFNQGKQRHTVYLGVYDSPESHAMYKRKVAEWFAAGGTEPPPRKAAITVSELLAAYWVHAKAYYVKDGEPTTQQRRIKKTIGMVGDLYGSTPASEFSPRALKAVREVMVREGWKRKVVNQRVQLIVQAFRWAVEEELVGATVHQALTAVDALKKGRTPAPESEKVEPAPEHSIEAVRPILSPALRDAMDVQLLTAARPGEVLDMRPCDLDVRGEVWFYRPESWKTEHHEGSEKVVYIGPRCQEILRKRWPAKEDEYFFSPRREMEERCKRLRAARKSPVQPSQKNRRKKGRKRPWGEKYLETSYGHAVTRACIRAGVEHFSPHQLRHSAATRIRAQFGIETASVILGHAHLSTTEIYAEANTSAAVKAMKAAG